MEEYNFDYFADGTPKPFDVVMRELTDMFRTIPDTTMSSDDFRLHAHDLYEKGYCVIDLLNQKQVEFVVAVVKRSVETFHELVSSDGWNGIERGEKLVLGVSGAIGIPSVYHHPGLRFLRVLIHVKAAMLFDYYMGVNPGMHLLLNPRRKTYHFQQICDRLCARFGAINAAVARGEKGLKWACGHALHRDQSYTSRKKLWKTFNLAHIFGGWLALTGVQQFGCAEGMHVKDVNVTLIEDFTQNSADEASSRFCITDVNPGQLLVFKQDIPHAMMRYDGDEPMWRLYTAFAVTNKPFLVVAKDAERARAEQFIVTIKNQARTPVYTHGYELSPDALEEWCMNTFKPQFLVEKKLRRNKDGREMFLVAKSEANFSLGAEGCAYAAYERFEHIIYNPKEREALGCNGSDFLFA